MSMKMGWVSFWIIRFTRITLLVFGSHPTVIPLSDAMKFMMVSKVVFISLVKVEAS